MEKTLIRMTYFISFLLCFVLTACAQTGKPQTDRQLRGMGAVVMYMLAPGVSDKQGVEGVSDAGSRLFGSSYLNPKNGGVSSLGGVSFPRWVRVTWRKDMTSNWPPYTTGKIVGDYKVEVLSRIPPEVFNYVSAARGRTIVLKFRIQDDGVQFAWAVQEPNPKGGAWVYKMEGGDFRSMPF